MLPEQKAKIIYDKFDLKPQYPFFIMSKDHVINCCLNCIDQICEVIEESNIDVVNYLKYWDKVKEEIKKL